MIRLVRLHQHLLDTLQMATHRRPGPDDVMGKERGENCLMLGEGEALIG